jgi:hypothetical protein
MNDETQDQGTFDADAFMNSTIDEPMATALSSVPDGEYTAMVGDFDSSAFKTIEYTDQKSQLPVKRQVLEVPFVVDDEALKAKLGREQVVHRETFWLDFTPDGKLDTGPDKNVNLGKLRACLGQNGNGPWAPTMLRNMGPMRIKIVSRQDKKDPEKKYTNITKYAPIT